MKAPYFLSLREIFIFQGLLLFFQHRNIRQARCTLICRITQIHNLMQAFSLSRQQAFCFEKYTYLSRSKKVKEKPTVDSQSTGKREDNTNLSSGGNCCPQLNIRCNCFTVKCTWISTWSKVLKWVFPRGNIHLRIYDSINMYFCLYKCCQIYIVLVITNWENFDVSWVFVKSVFSSQLRI